MTLDQVKSLVNENGIEFFLCSFVKYFTELQNKQFFCTMKYEGKKNFF